MNYQQIANDDMMSLRVKIPLSLMTLIRKNLIFDVTSFFYMS